MLAFSRLNPPLVFLAAYNKGRIGNSSLQRRLTESSMSVDLLAKPTYGWCCTASINKEAGCADVKPISGYGVSLDSPFRLVDNTDTRFDITKSADWMEFIERSEDRMDDEGGAGAYDTLRCDLILQSDPENKWRIWGKSFHFNRLQNSFLSLINHNRGQLQLDPSTINTRTQETDRAIETACELSNTIFEALLSEAETSKVLTVQESQSSLREDVAVQPIRLTFLWSPSRDGSDNHDIVVRGHACCSAAPIQVHRFVDPITVTIAAVGHDGDKNVTVTADKSLPNRLRDPQHKIASWTRLRKKMEKPETYMPTGVSEVLMVRPSQMNGHVDVLEGLSSNVFVVYKDGTIRTAQDGVLNGYVRHLVLECVETCGLKLDPRPILLHEATEGLWQEAFITSSTRLIFPIARILMHGADQKEFHEFWRDPALTECNYCSVTKPKWRQLLDEILHRGGYPLV
jgi:hypothetical protein